MSSAPNVLQTTAQKYASEAIKFDSQGARGTAIQMYQKSIESLIKLAKLYPNDQFTKTYIKTAKAYQERINALQDKNDIPSNDESNNSTQTNNQTGIVEPLKSSYDDVISVSYTHLRANET